MLDRRSFLKAAAGTAAAGAFGCKDASSLLTYEPAPSRLLDKIGLQLYTVRTLMADDFVGTLRAVADAGYDEVEFYEYYGREPAEVKDLLAEFRLEAPASHVKLEALRSDYSSEIQRAVEIGHRAIICPWLDPPERSSIDTYRTMASLFNEVGKACRDAGLLFGWHHHDYELQPIDGMVPMDILFNETDPDLVSFEIDLYWIRKGGGDPFTWFERYPGRFPWCHVKDMAQDGSMTEAGSGTTDFRAIFARAEQAGLEHYFVEHDSPADPLLSIQASYDYLASLSAAGPTRQPS